METGMRFKLFTSASAAFWASALLGLSAASSVGAAENGSTLWPLGVQTIAPALVPLPGGTQYYNYTLFYRAPQTVDTNGHSTVPGFRLDVVAEAARVVHTWQGSLYGITFSSGAVLAGNYVNVNAAGANQHVWGLNYAYLTPLYASWNVGNVFFLFGPSVYVPLGHFSAQNLANSTYNVYGYNQEFAVTWLASPRLEISAAANLTFNGANPDTGYKAGAITDVDFNIDYAPFEKMPNLQFGINGYYAQQIQNDSQNGATVGTGNRLRKLAIGPQIVYYFNRTTAVALKWQNEVVARNTTKGNRIWVEFTTPL